MNASILYEKSLVSKGFECLGALLMDTFIEQLFWQLFTWTRPHVKIRSDWVSEYLGFNVLLNHI